MTPTRAWPPSSVAVNQAIGVTAEEFECTVAEAYDAIARHAEATHHTVEEVATEVVNHQGRCLG